MTGLSRPVFVAAPPGDTTRLFVVEQHTGMIRIFKVATGSLNPAPFLHITDLSAGNEQGLLGLAFAPDFSQSGLFYVNLTDSTGTTVVRRFKVSAADPDVADPAGAVTVLKIPQPFNNHNGGWIGFGPMDGLLYIGVGDGGAERDPQNRSQDLGQLLGKMLRIDVRGDDFPGDPAKNYAIPPNNPFVGNPGALPEIWAFGLRNPWRCSFDRQTGDLYIGDVGQDKFEEINFQPASSRGGENYGWSLKEGSHPFKPQLITNQTLVDPIDEYSHQDGGVTVVGGYVYRDQALTGLAGTYFYADSTGFVTSFRFDGQTLHDKTDRTNDLFPNGAPSALASFGEDAAGELYLVNLIPGEIYQFVQGS